jgi:hypothetical protein
VTKLPWSWFDHRTDVPQWVAAGIGRAVVEWAVLEREIEEVIHLLLDVDIKDARIIANKMDAEHRAIVVVTLLQARVYNDRFPAARLKEFSKIRRRIKEHQVQRDILAHGLWGEHNGEWRVLRLRQSRNTPQLEPDIKSLSRAVLPQIEPINRNKLREIAIEIVSIAKETQKFCADLRSALSPSRYIQPQYARRRYRYPRQPTKKTQQGQP